MLPLAAEPGGSGAELPHLWAIEKMAVNRASQRLVDNGHVSRIRDPNDRLSYQLALTAKGNKLYEKITPQADKRYNELISAVSEDELNTMVEALRKMIQRAEELN